jgi:hypothetical protein
MLADMTAMMTLGLHDERDELARYVDGLTHDDGKIRFLLQAAVVLYAEAFSRLGEEQGFDAQALTRRIALQESRERWGVPADD